ncbi:glycine--tRNA ligase subunit beta [Paenibacillus hunanensis]|uniref:Glycine--tRNA ligase beta subunit n=1 Tax=Paenibacillus hunanensis TaxID=539262 RepID=A0ABU1J2N7_9BACL|nr:glycine--tRNA ligase subunit beta [Paenibacillus hunanensis]MDR6245771.1 glycyl-tRNA synthetase beta chain [Paenibacillus hunanensis]GGJ19458.1 glycine--tRNA ligase beta subunit [Paenibacillus hunanensis]
MAKDLLLEIGLEEVPARFLRAAMNQLLDKTVKWLDDSRLAHGDAKVFATPRRLAVWVKDVAEKQEDINEEVKGPSRKIAQDETGNWSKAALGFARSQGVDPADFTFREVGGVEYIYAQKSSIGASTDSIVADALHQIITSLTFPKNMRWGDHDFRFVRPIRWMVALWGHEVIDFEITGVKTGRTTRGHRFLGTDTEIAEPTLYMEALREQHVIADVEERQAMISAQIAHLAAQKNWHIDVKDDLLEEVLFLVETPTVLYGTFDPAFLNIPQDVLITSMREHQRYFPVLDSEGQLLPFFVTVRNGNDRALDVIAKGNEKVLRARLSDAKFFYEEDQKLKIADAVAKLDNIVFHEEIGTLGEKVRRVRQIADQLGAALQVSPEQAATISRTADIAKFDLVTQMVYEFPELQGVMGEDYARKAGESEEVARAIFEHYQPRFSGDSAPASLTGSIISIAEKIDTIVACFSIGIIPTGSQDPYALRRQAAGIVQILLERELPLTLEQIFDITLNIHENLRNMKRSSDIIRIDLNEFFGLRVKKLLSETLRYDVVDAVISAGFSHIGSVVARGNDLMKAVQEVPDFKLTIESFERVSNLAAKSAGHTVDAALFSEAGERDLYAAWESVTSNYNSLMDHNKTGEALALLATLRPAITAFFDHIMVMVDDEAVRENRLALLAAIDRDVKRFADFSKLVK